MDIGWTLFWERDTTLKEFHHSFLEKMSTQLETHADKLTSIKQFEKYGFQLIYGMVDINLKYRDNMAFSTIDLITPTSMAVPLTICWMIEDETDITKVHTMDVSEKKINFYWCNDFPTENLKVYCKPYRTQKKAKTGYSFDIEYYHYSLQDVILEFEFNTSLKKTTLHEIDNYFEEFRNQWNQKYKNKFIKYISKLSHIEDMKYSIALDLAQENNVRTVPKLLKLFAENFPQISLNKIVVK